MSDGWDIVNEYADTVADMVAEENKLKELLRDVYAEAAASWGTSGANAALARIKELTEKYGNPTEHALR